MAAGEEFDFTKIIHAEVDVRSHYNPFDFPRLPEVVRAIDKEFADDRKKVVKALQGPRMGLYKILSSDYTQYKDRVIKIRDIEIPITFHMKGDNTRRDGVLVTIYDSYVGEAQNVEWMKFNEYFINLPDIRVKTHCKVQFYKDTTVMNGNRYIILHNFDIEKTVLPEFVEIGGMRFKIQYRGQQKYCYLCEKAHGETCPIREKFNDMRQIRENQLTHKIYSDSTLRNANQLALALNIVCMSGGGVGQIANAIPKDPEKQGEIIIVAGANEMRNVEDAKEFSYTARQAANKLNALVSDDRRVHYVLPTIPRTTPEIEAKYALLKEEVTRVKNVTVIDIQKNKIEYESDHPTCKGANDLLIAIQRALKKRLILEKDYTTSKRIYSQVYTIFKVGCRTCDSPTFTNRVCDTCQGIIKDVTTDRYDDLLEEFNAEYYPAMEEVDDPPPNELKRPFDATNDNKVNSKAKKNRFKKGGRDAGN